MGVSQAVRGEVHTRVMPCTLLASGEIVDLIESMLKED